MKAQQRQGAIGENHAAAALARLGVRMVTKKETPTRIVGGRVIRYKKADADFDGIYPPTGQRVLVEVKARDGETLPWSELRSHQINRLDENEDCRGISLLVWAHSAGTFVLRWPITNFGPGRSVALEYAKLFDLGKLP